LFLQLLVGLKWFTAKKKINKKFGAECATQNNYILHRKVATVISQAIAN